MIPNELFAILTEMSNLTLPEIKQEYDVQYGDTIDEYFGLLIDRDYGFWCDEPENFPALDLSWDRPEAVTNAIIDVDADSSHDYGEIFSQLDGLGCQAVQIRAYDALSMEELEGVLQACQHRRLRHLDLIIKYQPELTPDSLSEFCLRYQVISRVVVHSSPAPSRKTLDPLPILIRFDPAGVTADSCGEVAPGYFSLALEHFTEAHGFNTCLNRKLSVTARGEIKACPAMKQSYGIVGRVTLASAATNPELVRIGRITKDQIAVCRDCEFRYICTDCRAFTEGGDLYSKPAKCTYDPYTASWGAASGTEIPAGAC
jgi:SPASM domain peptide maturase of grasp-with-spasm system